MSKNKSNRHAFQPQFQQSKLQKNLPAITSLLDKMEVGKEFESLVQYPRVNIDLHAEIKKSIKEISDIRKRPLVCYLANVVNPNVKGNVGINLTDDLPFSEMIDAVPAHEKKLDIMLVTPGGSGEQVARFVDKLRPRFDDVAFILPYMAMSSGTIFVASGNDIIMDSRAYIGPIDPQVPNRNGNFIPAQSILTLIKDIQDRGAAKLKNGQSPDWTDLQILKQVDQKEIGLALNGSAYSIELVEEFLYKYKFKTWTKHQNGSEVTDAQRKQRAKEIAVDLCDHSKWKTHSRGITREVAWAVCKIKITHSESIEGLHNALRRFWALLYWGFENTSAYKIIISDNYRIFRNDPINFNFTK